MATKILWTDETWNPIVGCSKISAGCQNCYAEKMAFRLANMNACAYREVVNGYDPKDDPKAGKWNGKTAFVESALSKPLHWRAVRKIFVCSMGDLFHESVPFEWIDKVFAVMALCPQHTFQVLTKRADRMKEYFDFSTDNRGHALEQAVLDMTDGKVCLTDAHRPLPNVWLGVTAENQEMADKRIPILLQTPAALRFVSVEPMLGAVDLDRYFDSLQCPECKHVGSCDDFDVLGAEGEKMFCNQCDCGEIIPLPLGGLDWVIVGAESGASMRWCAPEWPRSLVKQCQSAEVPVFVKQLHTPMINTKFKLIKEPAGWPRELPGETIINNQ